MGKVLIAFTFLCLFVLTIGMALAQEHPVSLTPSEALLNKGESLKALCNIPGLSILDIISILKVRWYHNKRQLTSLCEFEDPSTMSSKYVCNVLSPTQKNISLEFTILDVQKKNTGNLTCEVLKQVKENGKWVRDEFVAKKDVQIKVRGPITTMSFKFDQSKTGILTLDNKGAPHRMEVDPGMYRPTCMVKGSTPKADVRIMMGNETMPGKMVDLPMEEGTQFVADGMEFKGNTESLLVCKASVPGLPNSTEERTYRIVVPCNPGRYGTDCKEKCGHCESNETCHHVNGSCPALCEPGYHGEKCLTVCQKGFYGRNCSSPCGHCAKNATCDHVTGSCPSGYCEPGWKYTPEQRCNQACNNGWYGVECKESCGYCRGNKACHHVNGSCFGLCEPGYHGEKCENSEFSQLLAIQRKMLEFVRELLTRKRSKAELKENGTSPTDFK